MSKACDNVIFFFDSCHSGLQIDTKMRGLYSDMNKNEFIEAIKNKTYCIGFAACKHNESSYPITALKHGAWTYHLIESLNGMAPDALEKGCLLTANSLQAYLSRAVPLSLKKAYTVSKTQTPWIFGGSETDILLGDLTTVIKKNKAPLPSVQAIELEITSFGSIKSLSGFKKTHTMPRNVTHSTEMFVHSISYDDLEEEVSKIHNILRSSFNYKRADITQSEGEGSKSLLTPEFVIHISINQDQDDFEKYTKVICLTEITDYNIIKTESFNTAFATYFDSLVIKLDKPIKVVEFIDAIETLSNSEIELNYPSSTDSCSTRIKNIPGKINIYGDEIVIAFTRETRPEVMIDSFFKVNEKLRQLKCEKMLLQ